MSLFFLLSALLVIVVLMFLLPVFTRASAGVQQELPPDRTETNVSVAKAQLAELRQKHEAGEISQEVFDDEKKRLTAALARDLENDPGAIARANSDKAVSSSSDSGNSGQWMLWPLAAALPIAAGMLYLHLGTPAAIDPANRVAQQVALQPGQQQLAQQQPGEPPAPDMQEIVTRIKQRLAAQPNDPRGWFMLGRAHLTLGEYEQAEEALRRSLELDSSNVDVAIRLADAIALTQEGSLAGEPVQILETALQSNPDHPQGLWLYGMALSEAGDQPQAVSVWQRLLTFLGDDPASTREVEMLIANAQQQMGEAPATTAGTMQAEGDKPQSAVSELQIAVDVEAGLASDLPQDTPVFVYAKAAAGPPMPLAVVKHALADLPLQVTLTDAQAMIDTMKLSAFNEVIVGARIAISGDPIARSGDLFVESASVDTSTLEKPLSLTISETVP